jgi:hypothetical protein
LTTASVFSLCLLKKLLRAPGLNRQDNHKFWNRSDHPWSEWNLPVAVGPSWTT